MKSRRTCVRLREGLHSPCEEKTIEGFVCPGSQFLDLLASNDLGITKLRLVLLLVVTRRTCDIGDGAEVEQGGQEQRLRLGWAAT